MVVDQRKSIYNEKIKAWYLDNVSRDFFNQTTNYFQEIGYELDLKSGLLIRDISSDKQTKFDLVTLRPLDLHHHEDINEYFVVLNGEGDFLRGNSEDLKSVTREYIVRGRRFLVPREIPHAFVLYNNSYLSMNVECNGVLDSSKERCLKSFDHLNELNIK